MRLSDFPNRIYNPNAVLNHRWRISLGGPFLSVEEVPCTIPIPDHQGGLVVVTVEINLCDTGSLVPDRPQHCGPVLLIESIARNNEKKPPVLFL